MVQKRGWQALAGVRCPDRLHADELWGAPYCRQAAEAAYRGKGAWACCCTGRIRSPYSCREAQESAVCMGSRTAGCCLDSYRIELLSMVESF
ncbi:hypothetical protein VSQ48_19640 [Candidatus Ventrimonas sp. KK005]